MCILSNAKSPHKHKIDHHLPTKLLHPPKRRNRLKMMKLKIKKMSHLKRKTWIKGEMKMIKTRKMIKKFRVKARQTTPKSPPSNSTRSPHQLHPL
jgi:hypothetical protein